MTKKASSSKKDLSQVKYIISDWDGTLVDSFPNYTVVFSRLMREKFGVDQALSSQYYISTAGEALTNQIREAAKRFAGQSIENTIELEQLFWDYQKDSPAPPIIEGALETLKFLKEKGYKIIIWSGTRTDILGIKLQQTRLGQFVDFYIGNEPGSQEKVKGPFLFEEIAKHSDLSAEDLQRQAVVIGDGRGDMKAGQKVHCPTIGTLRTTPKQDLRSAGADFIIPSIKDLPGLLTH